MDLLEKMREKRKNLTDQGAGIWLTWPTLRTRELSQGRARVLG